VARAVVKGLNSVDSQKSTLFVYLKPNKLLCTNMVKYCKHTGNRETVRVPQKTSLEILKTSAKQ